MLKFNIGDYVKINMLDPTYKDYVALSKSIFKIIELHDRDKVYLEDYYKLEYYSGDKTAAIEFLFGLLGQPDPPISRNGNEPERYVFQDIECIKLQRKDKLNNVKSLYHK